MDFIKQIRSRFQQLNPQLRLFLAGIMLVGVAGGIFETTFNNFLNDTFNISANARGYLEFPRELPGFLTALFAGMLFFLPETMIAAFCAFAIGLGMIGIAIWGESWMWMITFMIVWSSGMHLMMPIRSSVTMCLADSSQKGRRLGQVAGAGVAATLVGCVIVWVGMKYLNSDYSQTFVVGGISAILGGAVFAFMRLPGAHLRRPSFVWNRKYWLFYVLAMLFGARKQIFITFGPWVLVKIFHQPAYIIAQLWIAAAVLGMFFNPLLGGIIDRFGERRVLVMDSIFVFMVCMGYGLSHLIESRHMALWLLYVCYVTDHLLFGVNMARTTYLSKIVVKREDIAPTLSLGITINHAVSMSVPALGGIMWMKYGHSSVFMGAAVVAVVMLIFSSMVRVDGRGELGG
jgi:MFS family permease